MTTATDTKKQQHACKQAIYNEGHSAALQGMARNTLYKELFKLYWNMGYDDGLLKLYNLTRKREQATGGK